MPVDLLALPNLGPQPTPPPSPAGGINLLALPNLGQQPPLPQEETREPLYVDENGVEYFADPDEPLTNPDGGDQNLTQSLVQGLGRSVADTIGFLPDLASAAANAGLGVADWIAERFGGNVDFRFPGNLSDTIADTASEVGENWFGIEPLDYDEMGTAGQLLYNAGRFGGGAVGGGGLMRAATTLRPASNLPRALDPILKPYEESFIPTLARDTAAGVGAGTGLTVYDQTIGGGDDERSPIGAILAMLAGGAGGSLLYDIPVSGLPAVTNNLRRGTVDRNIPYDENGRPTSHGTAQDAGAYLQREAGGPDAAATAVENLDQNMAMTEGFGAPTLPLGQASQNLGLARVERATMNTTPGVPIIDRNREVTSWAGDVMQGIAPTGDPSIFPRVAGDAVKSAEDDAIDVRDLAMGTIPAARLIDDQVSGTLRGMQERNSDMWTVVDPNRQAPVDLTPVQNLAGTVVRNLGQFNTPEKVIPAGLLERILGPQGTPEVRTPVQAEMQPPAGNSVLDPSAPRPAPGPIPVSAEMVDPAVPPQTSVGDIAAVMPELAETIQRAQRAGNYTLADNLRSLQQGFRSIVEQAAAAGDPAAQRFMAAQQNWQTTLGENFARGPGDAASDFRDDYNVSRFNRTTTPPSQTASQFLQPGRPEDAASLMRIINAAPNPVAGQQAASGYVLGRIAGDIVSDNNRFHPMQLARMMQDWGEVIDVVPGLRSELDSLMMRARAGEDITNSALALVAGRTPTKALDALMQSPNPAERARDLMTRLSGDPQALESVQRATGEWLFNRLTTTNTGATADGTLPITYSALVRNMENPDVDAFLAEIFDPQSMQAMQQVRRVFDLRQILAPAAGAPGSATASNLDGAMRLFEAGLRTFYGGLRGGNIARNIKVGMGLVFRRRDSEVQQLVARAMVDPVIARHLLSMQLVEDPGAWASRLSQLMRWGEASRQANNLWFGNGQSEQNEAVAAP